MKLFIKFIAIGLLSLIVLVINLWAIFAIYYSNLPWQFLRIFAACVFPLLTILIFVRFRKFRKAICFFLLFFAAVLILWLLIPASNNRNWQKDVAVIPYAVIDGNIVTVHNIRNFDYRSEDDYTTAYYDKSFDLSKLQGADLFICFWGPKNIAHTIMSFCFEGNQYICISIETRKEITETYSSVKGFFKQYELIYVVGDERDPVRLRTNFRKETVYLYRLNSPTFLVREVFLDYLKTINQLKERPQWYNALTQNCTTAIRGHTKPYAHGKLSWKIIANGYLDSLLYERKTIDTKMPFEQLKSISMISEKAIKAGDSSDFSSIIRQGLPNPHLGIKK